MGGIEETMATVAIKTGRPFEARRTHHPRRAIELILMTENKAILPLSVVEGHMSNNNKIIRDTSPTTQV